MIVSLQIDVTYYPFDTQLCELKFASWTMDMEQVVSINICHLIKENIQLLHSDEYLNWKGGCGGVSQTLFPHRFAFTTTEDKLNFKMFSVSHRLY